MAKKQDRKMRRVAEAVYVRDGRYFTRLLGSDGRGNHYPDEHGKPNTKAGALELRDELRARKRRRGPANETVQEFADRWTRDFSDRRGESTLIHNAERIKAFTRDFGKRKLGDVTRREARLWVVGGVAPHDLEREVEGWEGARREHGKVIAPGHPRHHPVVRAMYSDAQRDELIDENPFMGLRISESKGRSEILVLKKDEVAELAGIAREVFADGEMFAAMILLAAWTGMRPGEIFALEWGDIDFDRLRVHVQRQRQAKTGRIALPKNKKGRRIVLPPPAADALKGLPRQLHDELVFHTSRGKPFSQRLNHYYWDKVRREFIGKLCERDPKHHLVQRLRADPKNDLDFYELRHFCATYLLDMRGPSGEVLFAPRDVAVQLGHTDGGRMVMETYGHPDAELSLDRISAAFRLAS